MESAVTWDGVSYDLHRFFFSHLALTYLASKLECKKWIGRTLHLSKSTKYLFHSCLPWRALLPPLQDLAKEETDADLGLLIVEFFLDPSKVENPYLTDNYHTQTSEGGPLLSRRGNGVLFGWIYDPMWQ